MSERFQLQFGPTASALILAVSRGLASEILAIGTRGESKTCAALAAMGAHASEHRRAGFPLPVSWCGIMDTFQSHKEKTHKSLLKPFWQGVALRGRRAQGDSKLWRCGWNCVVVIRHRGQRGNRPGAR